jgi:metal-responsive CopG/Arc/MetJ family transcriptional regulator
MHQRINITLPKDTIQMIDQITRKGNRSALIDRAVRHFVRSVGQANLRKRLKKADPMRAARDLQIAEEWFNLGDDD